jgi:predicted acetylornithine/succinylornithine family transaminase
MRNPTNKSARLIGLGDTVLMQNYARFPLVLTAGNGATVTDADGKSYLDFASGIAVSALGHADVGLTQAVAEQSGRLIHVSNLYYNEPQIRLAQILVRRSFADKVFFCNSGAEANEAAIKLARKFARERGEKKRFEIVTAHGSFHGRTFAALSATGQERYHKGFEPLVPGFRYVPYDNPAVLRAAVTPKTAAVMLEPVQGEGGVRIPKPDYLAAVRKICDRAGALLILDEVQTGIGRTGRLFGYEHAGMVPDIMTLAKGLGGGVPIGAMLATNEVSACFTPGSHASTFGGNPLVSAAAVEVLTRINAPFLTRVRTHGKHLLRQLSALAKQTGRIESVRGVGLMVAADLSASAPTALEVIQAGHARGLLLNKTSDRTLRFVPPLTITREEIDRMIALLSDVLQTESA